MIFEFERSYMQKKKIHIAENFSKLFPKQKNPINKLVCLSREMFACEI